MDRDSSQEYERRMKLWKWRRAGLNWGERLLAFAWAIALVFVAGMVIGGLLNSREAPEERSAGAGKEKPTLEVVFMDRTHGEQFARSRCGEDCLWQLF